LLEGRKTFLVLVGVAVIALAAGFLLGRRVPASSASGSAPIVEAIRKVAKLATVEIEVADVVKMEEVRTIVVFDIPKNATLRLRGKVMGGFDLNAGFTVVADDAARTLHVTLPPPGIVSVDSRVEWWDERSRWLNPITPEDRTRWSGWARGSLARAAKDAGLLKRSEDHARELIVEASRALGWKAIVTIDTSLKTPNANP